MKTDYEKFERSDSGRRLLQQEDLIMQVLEELSRALETKNISKTWLAQRLGKTKGFVSQILSGGRNLTLRTVADVCWATGYTPKFELGRESRNLAALTSVQNRVCDVNWGAHQGMEVNEKKKDTRSSDAPLAANQELGVAA